MSIFRRRRAGLSVAGLGLIALIGCASDELKQVEQEVGVFGADIETAPAPSRAAVAWPALVATARSHGVDFLQIKLAKARQDIALDARKQGRNPKVSAVLRSRVSAATSTGAVTSGSSIALGFDYDLANALLSLDKKSIALTEELIAAQKALSDKQAEVSLLESYFQHLAVDLDLREARLAIEEARCARVAMETEIALGQAAPDALSRLSDRSGNTHDAVRIFAQEKQIAADRVLSKAGYQMGGTLSSSLSGVPLGNGRYDAQQCYAASGSERRDELLLGLAEQSLKLAKVSRFTKVSALLPTQIDPQRGLDLDVLINWVIPLIDQGETKRQILNARLDLLTVALTARTERLRTQDLFSRARSDMATQQLRASRASAGLATSRSLDGETSIEQCRRTVERKRTETELTRADLKLRLAKARLAILCS